jgi:hypothetical protein
MMFALGAVSSALDAVKSLTSSNSSSAHPAGFSEAATDPFDLSGGASAPGSSAPAPGTAEFSQLSPATMSALLAAQSQSSTGSATSASTSPSDALQDLFSQIDASSTGDPGVINGASSGSLLQALAGASSTSVTNGDGSTTTSLTSADGSKVTMTSPAATTASTAATSSYNLIEQMIQREAQSISFLTTPSLSLSA